MRKTHDVFKLAMDRHKLAKERFQEHADAWNF